MDIDRIMEENAEVEVLEYLTENGYLEGAAHGIALQVIGKGRSSLSPKQEAVFQRYVVDEYFNLECARCHIPMPTCEIVYALASGDGLCSWCNKMVSNDD
jgi:hypothetical protein